jgi:peptide/nickel transport system substrate-binding protein
MFLSRRVALQLAFSSASAALLAACGAAATPAAPTVAPTSAAPAAAKPTAAQAQAQATTGASTTTAPAPAPAPTAAGNALGLQAAPTPVPPALAKLGGTLRIGIVGDITGLDPFLWSPNNSNTVGQVHDQLITYDEKFTPQPRLAESWELSPDNKTIKFNLRRGVQYQSGREFTSDDVKYSLLKAKNPKTLNRATVGPGADYWNTIDTPDKYTIVLSSDTPRPGAFDSILYLRILDQELDQSPDAATKMNGTGPLKLVEWVSGDHITLAKSQNYWEPNEPYLDEVDIKVYGDQSAMTVAFEAGAIDVAFQPSITDSARLQADPKFQIINYNQLGQYFYLQVNTANPPMDNKLFRQAIAYTIDRPRFADSIMKGFAGPARDLPWGQASPAWEADKNTRYTFDLEKAKALLDQSGVSNPQFDLAFPLASFSGEYRSLAQIIQEDLGQIGITTTLKPTDIAKFTADGIGVKPAYVGARLNAAAFTNVSEPTSHFILSSTYGAAINASSFYDDAYRAMITAAATEPDTAKRKQGYSQINDYLLDQCYCMTICGYPNILAQAGNVRGLGYYPVLQWTLRSTWLA